MMSTDWTALLTLMSEAPPAAFIACGDETLLSSFNNFKTVCRESLEKAIQSTVMAKLSHLTGIATIIGATNPQESADLDALSSALGKSCRSTSSWPPRS